jgi:creatinine deaminase
VAGEAGDGRAVLDRLRSTPVEVVLMDLRMPILDGIDTARRIVADPALEGVAVLALTTVRRRRAGVRGVRAGASGFLLKDAEPDDLRRAVRAAAAGEAVLDPAVTRSVLTAALHAPPPSDSGLLQHLTEREREVLVAVAQGMSNEEIGRALHMSPATARTHVGRVLTKLAARDRAQLAAMAWRAGLVPSGQAQPTRGWLLGLALRGGVLGRPPRGPAGSAHEGPAPCVGAEPPCRRPRRAYPPRRRPSRRPGAAGTPNRMRMFTSNTSPSVIVMTDPHASNSTGGYSAGAFPERPIVGIPGAVPLDRPRLRNVTVGRPTGHRRGGRISAKVRAAAARAATEEGQARMTVPLDDATARDWLAVAVEEARAGLAEGGIPIGGALIAPDGTVLGRGHNRRVQDDDPSVHGETDAFRNAGRQATYRGTTMVTTLSPCWYCSGLVRQFGISRLVVGEARTFHGGHDWLAENGVEVLVLDDPECVQLMTEFIAAHPRLWNEDIGEDEPSGQEAGR